MKNQEKKKINLFFFSSLNKTKKTTKNKFFNTILNYFIYLSHVRIQNPKVKIPKVKYDPTTRKGLS